MFGGLINQDPTAPGWTALSATDFAHNQYWPNNFNDLASGLVTLFELLVVSGGGGGKDGEQPADACALLCQVNNWFVVMGGFIAVTSKAHRLFFIAFYALGVIVTLNLVVAFILVRSVFFHWYILVIFIDQCFFLAGCVCGAI